MNEINWCDLLSGTDLDADCQIFISTIQSIIKHFQREIKPRRCKRYVLPWISEDILKTMKERDLALKSALKSKQMHDKRKFTTLRNRVVKELRHAKASLFINKIREGKGNCKIIWEQLKKLTGKEYKMADYKLQLSVNASLIEDPLQVASAFNKHFTESIEMLTFSPPVEPLNVAPLNTCEPMFSLYEISQQTVNKIIGSLKNSKSKDAFGLDSTLFKTHKETLSGPITKIINMSFRQSLCPKIWKPAIITPVLKSGKATEVTNYRPISILPVVSKIAERCVADQIVFYLNNSPYRLHPMQFGFRANHSTDTATCFFLLNVSNLNWTKEE